MLPKPLGRCPSAEWRRGRSARSNKGLAQAGGRCAVGATLAAMTTPTWFNRTNTADRPTHALHSTRQWRTHWRRNLVLGGDEGRRYVRACAEVGSTTVGTQPIRLEERLEETASASSSSSTSAAVASRHCNIYNSL